MPTRIDEDVVIHENVILQEHCHVDRQMADAVFDHQILCVARRPRFARECK